MKKFVGILLLICLVFVGCPVVTQDDTAAIPTTPVEPTDPAFWFIEIYEKLIERVGVVSSDGYPDITDPSGIDMAQIVNTQYVCNAINAKWETSYTPVSGTATQAANCEYLLKLIDKANSNKTTFGSGSYATTQAVDRTAVD
ncbi:MAG: hypothetical protein LBK66_12655, partial [Spirochaetaceae bacterium]|nr:hypothetical protein [Spirochaetaceae bacterium]